MKRLICSLVIILCSFILKAQTYPVPINVANAPTQIGINNALKGKLILTTFTDTTAANAEGYLKNYDGALIKTTSPIIAIWYRDLAHTIWIQILPAGGSTGSSGWLLNGNILLPRQDSTALGSKDASDWYLISSNQKFLGLNKAGIMPNTVNSVNLAKDTLSGWLTYGSSGAGSTPTWQQTLDATNGKVLTSNNNITGAFAFSYTDPTSFTITKSSVARLLINNAATALRSASAADILTMGAGITNITSQSAINLVGGSSGNASTMDVLSDSMRIFPANGILIIDSLLNSTTQDVLVGWNTRTTGAAQKQIGYITIGTGVSLSGGVLSATGTGGTITGVTTFGSTPNANGLSVSGANILMQPADASNPGGVSTTTQTFAGTKTFTSPVFTTSATTGSTTFALLNTTATTVNAFGAATTLNIGAGAATVLNFGGSTSAAEFRFLEPSASGTNYTAVKAGIQASNITYFWPPSQSAGVMTNDGVGNLGWTPTSSLTGLPYIALTGTSTATGGMALDLNGNDWTISNAVLNPSGGLLANGDASNVLGNTSTGSTGTGIFVSGSLSDNTVYYNSSTIHDFQTGTVSFRAYGAGAATFDGSGNITSVSDKRAKHNILPFTYGLNSILKLNPSTFIYNQDKSNTVMSGFIAQDVQKAIPIAVHNNKGGMMSLETNAILGATVNSIQELYSMIVKQQKEIENLKQQLKNK